MRRRRDGFFIAGAAALTLLVPTVATLAPGVANGLSVISSVSLGGSGTVATGVPIELVAQIGPNQTMPGSVSFTDNDAVIPACSDVTVSPGPTSYETADCSVTYAATGTHSIVANFASSDSANSSAVSPPQVLTLLLGSTMTVSATPSVIVYGQPFTLSATVTGPLGDPTPTGTVDFFGGAAAEVGGCTATLVAGTGSCTTPNASNFGTVNGGPAVLIQAAYSGDPNYASSNDGGATHTSPAIDIKPATTTLTLSTSANPAFASVPPVFTATIADGDPGSGIPFGVVTFTVDGETACEPASNEGYMTSITCQASATDPYLYGGTIKATFAPALAGDYSTAASGTIQQVVQITPTATTAMANPNPAEQNTNVALSATVTSPAGTPNGVVTFTNGTTTLCASDVPPGPGGCLTKALPVGVDTITATFADINSTVPPGSGPSTQPIYGPSSTTFKVTVTASTRPSGHGYWLVGADGGIFTFGTALFHGSTGSLALQRPVVGITPTSDDNGYWLVASDGGIFSFGDTQFFGSLPKLGYSPAGTNSPKHLGAPIVAMVPSADEEGYFMVGADGGVFAFGDAKFAGSCPSIGGCSGTAVAVLPDASGGGYWLVTATGHIYTFGDATYHGAPGPQSAPVTAAVRTPDGGGYWVLLGNGTVFAYGDADTFSGSAGSFNGFNPATSIVPTSDGGGYWVTSANGNVYPHGDAVSEGSMAGQHLNAPIIAATGY